MGLHRLGNYLSQQVWNENVAAAERFSGAVGGRGVASGLALTAGEGLTLEISAGLLLCGTIAKEIVAFSVTVPPEVSRYVWINEAGLVSLTVSPDDLGGTSSCLGRVFTDEDSIAAVTAEGRCEVGRWKDLRTYSIGRNSVVVDTESGAVGIGKEPTQALDVAGAASFDQQVAVQALELRSQASSPASQAGRASLAFVAGELKVVAPSSPAVSLTKNGRPQAYRHASRTSVLTADLALSAGDEPIQALQAGGADREVRLPAVADLDWGTWFRIMNVGSSDDLLVKSFDGTVTLATLEPAEFVEVTPVLSAGLPVWPETAVVQSLTPASA